MRDAVALARVRVNPSHRAEQGHRRVVPDPHPGLEAPLPWRRFKRDQHVSIRLQFSNPIPNLALPDLTTVQKCRVVHRGAERGQILGGEVSINLRDDEDPQLGGETGGRRQRGRDATHAVFFRNRGAFAGPIFQRGGEKGSSVRGWGRRVLVVHEVDKLHECGVKVVRRRETGGIGAEGG